MNHQNLANLTTQYQQAYLIYCYKVMQYLAALAWLAEQKNTENNTNTTEFKQKSALRVKKIVQKVNQQKPTLKSLKHLEKPDVSTIVALGFPNGAMSAAFRVAFNEVAGGSRLEGCRAAGIADDACGGYGAFKKGAQESLKVVEDVIFDPTNLIGGGMIKGGVWFFKGGKWFWKGQSVVDRSLKISRSQLQKKFDSHAITFGITGSRNNKSLLQFEQSITSHVLNEGTYVVQGTYRQTQQVTHFFNPATNINVMRTGDGAFLSVWKLNTRQIENLTTHGGL